MRGTVQDRVLFTTGDAVPRDLSPSNCTSRFSRPGIPRLRDNLIDCCIRFEWVDCCVPWWARKEGLRETKAAGQERPIWPGHKRDGFERRWGRSDTRKTDVDVEFHCDERDGDDVGSATVGLWHWEDGAMCRASNPWTRV